MSEKCYRRGDQMPAKAQSFTHLEYEFPLHAMVEYPYLGYIRLRVTNRYVISDGTKYYDLGYFDEEWWTVIKGVREQWISQVEEL